MPSASQRLSVIGRERSISCSQSHGRHRNHNTIRPDLATALIQSSNSDNLTSDKTPTFTGTAEAGSTVELFARLVHRDDHCNNSGSGVSLLSLQMPLRCQLRQQQKPRMLLEMWPVCPPPCRSLLMLQRHRPSTPDRLLHPTGISNTDNNTSDTTPTLREQQKPTAQLSCLQEVALRQRKLTAVGLSFTSVPHLLRERIR